MERILLFKYLIYYIYINNIMFFYYVNYIFDLFYSYHHIPQKPSKKKSEPVRVLEATVFIAFYHTIFEI